MCGTPARDNRRMLIVGLVLAAAAAAFHVFIFALESLKWTEPETRKIFGVASEADAVTMKALAFNQGFYNLFLALLAIVGIAAQAAGSSAVGLTLAFAGAASMLAAAAVLFIASAPHRAAAVKQGAFPLLAVGSLGLGLML